MFPNHYRILWSVAVVIISVAWFAKFFIPIQGIYNSGIAFSIPMPTLFIYLLMAGLIGWIIYWHWRFQDKDWLVDIGAGLVIGGGLSNLIERFLNNGKVWDYLSIIPGGYFNIADIAVIAGLLLLLYKEFLYAKSRQS